MKHIGLFTIYICNYGAVLQTYALKRCIEERYDDVKVSVVDFYTYERYRIFSATSHNPLKRLFKHALTSLQYPALRRRNSRERLFISQEFSLTERFDDLDTLMTHMPIYDVYLTGSDQVFNKRAEYAPLFFQQFKIDSGIKAAYAPSFGQSSFSQEDKDEIKKLVEGFDFLSCREDDGAEMLSEVLGRKVPCVIDPTLLLTQEQWKSMMKEPDTDDKFLLVYDLNGGVSMLDIARKIAREKALRIYCITRHPDIGYIYKGIDRVIYDAGPREFVGYFSKASYVLTDSFHGTAFSIIFMKDFNTYIAVPRSSQRIRSLLANCGLSTRIIENKAGVIDTSENCNESFDNGSFSSYRANSLQYLYSFVGNEKVC